MIFAGGTGGHVFPGIAVAEVLSRAGVELHWVGTARGLESRIVPAHGISFRTISVAGMRRSGWLRRVLGPIQLLYALLQSVYLMLQLRPAVVLGMGGFVSGPGGLAAWLCRRPLVIHEQNAIAGLTNRWLSRVADVVLLAFPGSLSARDDARVTGNPVRAAIARVGPPAERISDNSRMSILVFGGSRGAHALNQYVPSALGALTDIEFDIVHQCGSDEVDSTKANYRDAGLGDRARVVTFIDDMASAYAGTKLVIARSGALTVAEIATVGVASILVPYTFAVDDHQTANARFLVERDAARLLPESDLAAGALAGIAHELLSDRALLLHMAEQARAASPRDAAQRVAESCLECANV